MKRFICLIVAILLVSSTTAVIAAPSSQNYTLKDYSFGSGGTDNDTGSSNYKLFGTTGQNTSDGSSSTNYTYQGGLASDTQAVTPQAPSLDNPATYYDRLHFSLDPGSDPSDYLYAIAISPDSFATTHYISKDLTVVDALDEDDWQTYTDWGGLTGSIVTGLAADTDYQIKVKAKQGQFTESNYSPTDSASTQLPSLAFSVSGDGDMGIWRPENDFSSTTVSTLTTSTNAYNGYRIYAFATQPMTRQNGAETIPNLDATYAEPSSWQTGQGFGYTTNDTLVDGEQQWNQDPCPKDSGSPLCYAPFSQNRPGDVVADHENVLSDNPVIDEAFNLTYKVVTQASQVAGSYSTTIVYTVVPTY